MSNQEAEFYSRSMEKYRDKCEALEAKNVELNEKIGWSCKINSSLEVRLADAELIRDCNASQRDAAMRSLKIAVEALEKYQKAKVFTSATANLALAAINGGRDEW